MTDKKTVALVSGANRGIGLAIATGLAKKGVQVLMGARDLSRGNTIADALQAEGLDVQAVQLDTTDDSSVFALAEYVAQTHGQLDILVNNAGIALDYAPNLSAPEKISGSMEVNVTGTVRLTEAMIPLLSKSERARIVNVSSELASFGLRHDPTWEHHDKILPLYATTKAAVNALTVGYAKSLADAGIKVNAICPGYTATEATNFAGDRTPDQAAVVVIRMALLNDEGATGSFTNDQGELPW